jgi:VanZ family protein
VSSGLYRRVLFGALAVYWLAIFTATHVPTPEVIDLTEVSDKTLHYGTYAGLGLLLSASVAALGGWTVRRAAAVLLVVAAYGIVDELLQIPVNRQADVADWQADLVGGLTGVAAFSVLWAVFWRLTGRHIPKPGE